MFESSVAMVVWLGVCRAEGTKVSAWSAATTMLPARTSRPDRQSTRCGLKKDYIRLKPYL